MSLREAFEAARNEDRAALIIYVTAGDPDLDETVRIVNAIDEAGADIIELGIPYSDPIADGPTIQAAGQRALAAGTTVKGVLGAARQVRAASDIPLVIMTCYNPIMQYGQQQFADDARQAGVDAVLISDLPVEESRRWTDIARAANLDTVFLVAPTTSQERRKLVCDASTGFVYVISRPGTTGVRDQLPPDLPRLLSELREMTDRPLVVGFGISRPDHVQAVAEVADGAVVGSAVVDVIASHAGSNELLEAVSGIVSQLASATGRS